MALAVLAALARPALRVTPDALGPDARLPVPVHRQHRRLDDGGAGPPALAGLRPACAPPTAPRTHVSAGNVLFTLLGFVGLYLFIGILFLFLMLAGGVNSGPAGTPRRRGPRQTADA